MNWIRGIVTWLGWWVIYVVATIAAGAVLGALIFPVVGVLFQMEYEASYLFLKGVRLGAQYAGIWAGGLGIVLCFMRAYRLHGHKLR